MYWPEPLVFTPPITPPLTLVWRSRISLLEEIEHQVTYLMTKCTFINTLICQEQLRLRTTQATP